MSKKMKIKLYEILMVVNAISMLFVACVGLTIVTILGINERDMVNVFLGLIIMIANFVVYGISFRAILNRVYDLFD